MSARNNWDTSYPSILFMERVLSTHKCVESFSRDLDIKFVIQRTGNLGPVVAVLVGRYTISLADVIGAKAEFPDMQCIVAYGNWCAYTGEAKEFGLAHGIGVFQIGEFLGALFSKAVVKYVQKDKDGSPIYHYRTT